MKRYKKFLPSANGVISVTSLFFENLEDADKKR